MRMQDFESGACSIARTVDLVGDRWTVLVLRDLFNGVRRFDDLRDHLGISRHVLTSRLAGLVDAGLVERRPYREAGSRERLEYALTTAGRDLRSVLTALMDYGDAHLATGAGPPMQVRHRDCGAAVHTRLVCDEGHALEPEDRTDVVALAGAVPR